MRDLPEAPALLALARDVLVNDLLPLLPPERRLDARLVANCMAIAERETSAADEPAVAAIVRELEALYPSEGPSPSRFAGPSLSPHRGERAGVRGEASSADAREQTGLLRRFARELRIGGFENSPERAAQARAILWRSTIAKLRLANPRFLAANGFS
jgi:Domain of unknown function (DUF6285)